MVDDDPICHYIRAKTLLGTPGRGTDSEAAIRQVLDHRKLARDVDIAAARLLTGPTPAASRVASSNEAHCAFAPAGGRKGMLMTAFRALTARFTDPLELELVYTAWLNDLAYALNDLTLASEVMAMAVEKRVPSPHSIPFFASTCETIATTLTDNQQLKEALSWLGWMSELFRDDLTNLALVKKKSKASSQGPAKCRKTAWFRCRGARRRC